MGINLIEVAFLVILKLSTFGCLATAILPKLLMDVFPKIGTFLQQRDERLNPLVQEAFNSVIMLYHQIDANILVFNICTSHKTFLLQT